MIELMIAIAIVGILAAVALVSMISYRSKARSAKIVGALNSAVISMQNCWTFANGDVRIPASNENICYLDTSQTTNADQYGKWPDLSEIGSDYSYINDTDNNNCSPDNCSYLGLIPAEKNEANFSFDFKEYLFVKKALASHLPIPTSGCFPKSNWYFAAKSDSDNVKVCCNSKIKGCRQIDTETTCNMSIN